MRRALLLRRGVSESDPEWIQNLEAEKRILSAPEPKDYPKSALRENGLHENLNGHGGSRAGAKAYAPSHHSRMQRALLLRREAVAISDGTKHEAKAATKEVRAGALGSFPSIGGPSPSEINAKIRYLEAHSGNDASEKSPEKKPLPVENSGILWWIASCARQMFCSEDDSDETKATSSDESRTQPQGTNVAPDLTAASDAICHRHSSRMQAALRLRREVCETGSESPKGKTERKAILHCPQKHEAELVPEDTVHVIGALFLGSSMAPNYSE